MTSVNTGLNPYANYGSAYARAAATAQPSLANALNSNESASSSSSDAATNLTLSEAARAKLASSGSDKDIATVITDLQGEAGGPICGRKGDEVRWTRTAS